MLTPLVAAALLSPKMTANSIHDFTMNDIAGKPVALKKFKGKVLLVVNVASQCGLTPQYEDLQKLYSTYKSKGFEVLGFPANEFGGQEPGTNAEINSFCSVKYKVTFPMFSKIVVKGEGIHPMYQWLLAHSDRHDDIEWNFAKFLIGKNGEILHRFSPRTKPQDPEVVKAIEAALG
jgi:glutathione peroxidase